MPLLDPQVPAQIGALQSLDDAIAYRLDRLNAPCPDCNPAARCAEHCQDEHAAAIASTSACSLLLTLSPVAWRTTFRK